MSALLDRLRAALAPEYAVERELASGGMGMIFLGRDVTLDRSVAIKIIRPELASAHAAERFLREARLLATLNHANVVPIHSVGERGGFFFYVMAHLEGETLADRLTKGPLPLAEALRLCRDLLDALEAAHERGVVHRDIKPDNIFLVRGRAVLTDFGIAKSLSDPATSLTAPGQPVGTLEYMPPEQAAGGEVTARTDLYALAMVAYEAIAGRHWSILDRPETADWSGMPHDVARALRKALAWHPAERWADAAAFRRALRRPRHPLVSWPAAVVAGLLGGVMVAAAVLCRPLGLCREPEPRLAPGPYELMVVPFEVEGATAPRLGTELAWIVSDILALFPQISLVPRNLAFQRWEDSLAGRRAVPVRVAAWARGSVARHGDVLEFRLEVRDSLRRRLHSDRVVGRAGAEVELADSIALRLIRWRHPGLLAEYGPRPTWGLNAAALAEFLNGEFAFRRDAWSDAARHFRRALQLDPSFARAAWRLANAQRWRREPAGVDLRAVLARQSRYLTPLDSLLIEAELAPQGAARYRIYELAAARYPNDPYTRLLYGAELMHRGPLAGIALDSGAAVLEEAVAQDPSLAPAHDQLVWAFIRLGRRQAARQALDRLEQIRGPAPTPDLDIVAVLEAAFAARFEPERFAAMLPLIPPGVGEDVAHTLRFALGCDVPEAQLELARRFAAGRASGHEAQGLALVALGRLTPALSHFDSAAVRFATPTASLEAQEWRVVPAALGVPGVPSLEVERGRAALATIATRSDNGAAGVRAAWALAVDADARRDNRAARAWRAQLRRHAARTADRALRRLDVLLGALDAAAGGDAEAALRLSATLLPFDESDQLGDPFARAVLHVRRAEWHERLGRADAADREWLWYENSDFEGWLTDEVEPAEIDWALGVWARWRRGTLAMSRGEPARGCAHLQRVIELWTAAEPPYAPLVAEARRRWEACAR